MDNPSEELLEKNKGQGRSIARIFKSKLIPIEGKKVLEIGAGAGGILDILIKGAETTALNHQRNIVNI